MDMQLVMFDAILRADRFWTNPTTLMTEQDSLCVIENVLVYTPIVNICDNLK
jgi:hypothetical protein